MHFETRRGVRRLKAVTSRKTGIQLWQPNYYEHVIRNEQALRQIRKYIVNNPSADIIEFKQFYD
jgi:REP element-mobilizing transposase RayT